MRWLVTGGAGFLGINLVRHLLARGGAVVSLDREPFTYPDACDVVVHAAAALPLYPAAEIQSIDVDGTRVCRGSRARSRSPSSRSVPGVIETGNGFD